jgi:hypothetical protein
MAVMRAISLKYDPDQVFRKLVKVVTRQRYNVS